MYGYGYAAEALKFSEMGKHVKAKLLARCNALKCMNKSSPSASSTWLERARPSDNCPNSSEIRPRVCLAGEYEAAARSVTQTPCLDDVGHHSCALHNLHR